MNSSEQAQVTLGTTVSLARRRRLFTRLDASGSGPIAVVAPAGYGKTSLIEHWATTGPQRSQHWSPGQALPTAGRLIVDDADRLTEAEVADVMAAARRGDLTVVVLARRICDWIRELMAAPTALTLRSSHLRYRESELTALAHGTRHGDAPGELMQLTGGIPALVTACLLADHDDAVDRAAAAVIGSFSAALHEPILKLAVNGATPLADLPRVLSLPSPEAKEAEEWLRAEGAVMTTLSGVVALEPGLAAPLDRWLRGREPERYAQFHHDAAERLEAQGEPIEALRHATAVGDRPVVHDLLRRWWARLWVTDEQFVQHVVRRCVDAPEEFPAGFELLWRSAWQREGALIDAEVPGVTRTPDCEALWVAVRTLFAVRSGCRRDHPTDVKSLADQSSLSGALLTCAAGLTDVVDGRVWDGVKTLDVALEIADRFGDRRLRDHAITLQALALALVGDLAAASQRLAALTPVVGRTPELRKLALALVDLESGRVDQAAENLTLRVARRVDSALRPVVHHALWLCDVAWGRADAVVENDAARIRSATSYVDALADGVVQWVAGEEIAAPPPGSAPLTPESEWRLYLAARQRHDAGDHAGTLALLEGRLTTPAELTSRFRADLLLLAASALLATDNGPAAAGYAERAIRRVAVSGVERSFALMPPDRMAALDRLLHQRGSTAVEAESWRRWVPGPQPTPTVLTPREMGVLRYLATDATLAQIAERLFISRNTLKSHVRRIYRKLDTDGRSAAVAVAREQGLLENDRGPEAARLPALGRATIRD